MTNTTTKNKRRVALITGGATGIGNATVRELAERNFSIALVYNKSQLSAFNTVEELQAKNVNCVAFKCDLCDYNAVKSLYSQVTSSLGFVDTVINCAGVTAYKLFIDTNEDDFNNVINVNLKTVFNVCRHFLPDMVSNKFGRIVNVSSVWAKYGASMETLYCASKTAIDGLTRALSAEYAQSGITVNSVLPGMIDTKMNANLSNEEILDFLQNVDANRVGKPYEVAKLIAYLCEESSGYVTGQTISIDGGM